MTVTVAAVYEGGILRLKEPLALPEGTEVKVTVMKPIPQPTAPDETSTPKLTPAEIVARIAALPIESTDAEPFSGRDHDRILYGEDTSR